MKLGSLFDGSGGFPLAGALCGIEPVWASEVEPYPIAVTRERFPKMKHLGDISKINGAEIEPVDIITFGSPCQDLSVAGKRAGLKHEANGDEETTRSGLFMEAVRIIKEMREATNGLYPTFALWENVPGAFSSNKGEDFRIVCEELIKVVEPSAVMPPVPQNGWNYADSYIGDGWSLAYRVFDAQYWGVPQRRRRIHLIADFRGERAREILFEREGLRGYFAEGRTSWQTAPEDAQGGSGADDREGENAVPYTLKIRSGCEGGGKGALIQTDKSATLATNNDQYLFQPVYSVENHPADSRVNIDDSGKVQTLTSRMGTGGGNVPMVMEEKTVICLQGNGIDRADTAGCNGKGWREDASYTLNTIDRPAVVYAVDQGGGKSGANVSEDKAPTLCTTHGGEPAVAFLASGKNTVGTLMANAGTKLCLGNQEAFSGDYYIVEEHSPKCVGSENLVVDPEVHEFIADNNADAPHQQDLLQATDGVARTIACGTHGAGSHLTKTVYKHPQGHYIVRRLTPTECARLQGFADAWGHIEQKEDLTEEEYRFWLEARNTHAAINGKETKDYTKAQMLTWYNKLWTDSAEYKMWGNGIALPPALYCMQGIVEAINRKDTEL